jgi:hypothetical protein
MHDVREDLLGQMTLPEKVALLLVRTVGPPFLS